MFGRPLLFSVFLLFSPRSSLCFLFPPCAFASLCLLSPLHSLPRLPSAQAFRLRTRLSARSVFVPASQWLQPLHLSVPAVPPQPFCPRRDQGSGNKANVLHIEGRVSGLQSTPRSTSPRRRRGQRPGNPTHSSRRISYRAAGSPCRSLAATPGTRGTRAPLGQAAQHRGGAPQVPTNPTSCRGDPQGDDPSNASQGSRGPAVSLSGTGSSSRSTAITWAATSPTTSRPRTRLPTATLRPDRTHSRSRTDRDRA